MLERVKLWAKIIKRDIAALWLAARDPRTPLSAKILALMVASYALSPIDLIPDFIPVLGLLDDVILVPIGILLVVKLIPAPLMQEFRERASAIGKLPASRAGLVLIGALWVVMLAGVSFWLWNRL